MSNLQKSQGRQVLRKDFCTDDHATTGNLHRSAFAVMWYGIWRVTVRREE